MNVQYYPSLVEEGEEKEEGNEIFTRTGEDAEPEGESHDDVVSMALTQPLSKETGKNDDPNDILSDANNRTLDQVLSSLSLQLPSHLSDVSRQAVSSLIDLKKKPELGVVHDLRPKEKPKPKENHYLPSTAVTQQTGASMLNTPQSSSSDHPQKRRKLESASSESDSVDVESLKAANNPRQNVPHHRKTSTTLPFKSPSNPGGSPSVNPGVGRNPSTSLHNQLGGQPLSQSFPYYAPPSIPGYPHLMTPDMNVGRGPFFPGYHHFRSPMGFLPYFPTIQSSPGSPDVAPLNVEDEESSSSVLPLSVREFHQQAKSATESPEPGLEASEEISQPKKKKKGTPRSAIPELTKLRASELKLLEKEKKISPADLDKIMKDRRKELQRIDRSVAFKNGKIQQTRYHILLYKLRQKYPKIAHDPDFADDFVFSEKDMPKGPTELAILLKEVESLKEAIEKEYEIKKQWSTH